MAQKSFHCKLVTPMAALVDDKVTYASIPAWDGLMGILPGRAALLARLGLGPLRVDLADAEKGEASRSFLIEGGFVKMAGDQLTILAERATPTENLNLAEAEAELKTALAAAPAAVAGAERTAEMEKIGNDRARARMKVHLAKTRGGI